MMIGGKVGCGEWGVKVYRKRVKKNGYKVKSRLIKVVLVLLLYKNNLQELPEQVKRCREA